jgi:serine/threonine protein kinase
MTSPVPAPERSYQSILKDIQCASQELLRQTARDVFQQKVSGKLDFTSSIDPNAGGAISAVDEVFFSQSDQVPKFEAKELFIGRVMGRGTFCVVRECHFNASSTESIGSSSSRGSLLGRLTSSRSIRSSSGHRSISSERSGSSTLQRFRRKGSNKSRYVMKQLSSDLKDCNRITYLKGIVDLAMETRILASLDHENIVKLEAVSSCDAFSEGYFIVLEKVNETLSKKVKGWMDLDRQCKGITGVFTGSKSKVQRLQSERIAAAYDLSVGMNYLHERRIVFRDLVSKYLGWEVGGDVEQLSHFRLFAFTKKPDNIGFNYVGVLKIFDFGLAKKLDDAEQTKDGLYNMTNKTGAIRYMSPENLQGRPYDLTTDVYSWAMIMWFVLALEPPFAAYSEPMIEERVCQRGYRPKIFKTWSSRISMLMSRSWHKNPKERPSFATIAEELKKELAEVDPKLAQMVDKSTEILELPGMDK